MSHFPTGILHKAYYLVNQMDKITIQIAASTLASKLDCYTAAAPSSLASWDTTCWRNVNEHTRTDICVWFEVKPPLQNTFIRVKSFRRQTAFNQSISYNLKEISFFFWACDGMLLPWKTGLRCTLFNTLPTNKRKNKNNFQTFKQVTSDSSTPQTNDREFRTLQTAVLKKRATRLMRKTAEWTKGAAPLHTEDARLAVYLQCWSSRSSWRKVSFWDSLFLILLHQQHTNRLCVCVLERIPEYSPPKMLQTMSVQVREREGERGRNLTRYWTERERRRRWWW